MIQLRCEVIQRQTVIAHIQVKRLVVYYCKTKKVGVGNLCWDKADRREIAGFEKWDLEIDGVKGWGGKGNWTSMPG
jgi:hypothetical protein